MAAADHRGALTSGAMPPAQRMRNSWLGWIGITLALALVAVAALQTRHFVVLQQAMRSGDDYVVLMVYQAQTEYLRLREQWAVAADERHAPIDEAALRLRYEIFVSRIGLMEGPRPQRLIDGHPELAETMAAIRGFIARADVAFGDEATVAPDARFLAELTPALHALGTPLHTLSHSASHRVAEQMEARNRALAQLSRISLGLTLLLGGLTLAFAWMAVSQLRELQARRQALETLTEELQRARREAEAANEAKSVFLANMSHEIRTPFHGLMGMLSLLRETGLSARQVDYLRTATESADHLLAILNDILDLSQLESGRMTLTPAPVELRGLLRDVEALMRPQAMAKSLALHIDAEPQVPERVMADATRVKQILFNLLSNAIKFSDRGAVVLDLRVADSDDSAAAPRSRELRFIVTDNGPGIDPAAQRRLFNRFAPGEAPPARRQAGAGLGLEISRNLALLMGGDIQVRSRLGEGSRFTLRVPLQPVSETAPTRDETASGTRRRPLQVLVAEDHPVNRQYMAALLENLGHQAHFCTNGEEAVTAVRERGYDIVLMDLHMPIMDGLAATRAIRALPDATRSTVPIFALTADAFAETRERCLVAGMNDFLTKPVSPQKLASALRRLFGSASPPAEADDSAPVAATLRPGSASPALVDPVAVDVALQIMPRERLAAMIEAFLTQGPQTVQRLRAAVRDAQPLELRVNAHAARGAALNLGLAALAATAEALHEGASHLPAHEIALLVKRYEDLLPQTRQAVEAVGLATTTTA